MNKSRTSFSRCLKIRPVYSSVQLSCSHQSLAVVLRIDMSASRPRRAAAMQDDTDEFKVNKDEAESDHDLDLDGMYLYLSVTVTCNVFIVSTAFSFVAANQTAESLDKRESQTL